MANANGRIRRWLPRQTDLDELSDEEIQDIAMTLNLTPRKCLGFRSPAEAFLNELGKPLAIRFNARVALRVWFYRHPKSPTASCKIGALSIQRRRRKEDLH